jgi:hypothetical protein
MPRCLPYEPSGFPRLDTTFQSAGPSWGRLACPGRQLPAQTPPGRNATSEPSPGRPSPRAGRYPAPAATGFGDPRGTPPRGRQTTNATSNTIGSAYANEPRKIVSATPPV